MFEWQKKSKKTPIRTKLSDKKAKKDNEGKGSLKKL